MTRILMVEDNPVNAELTRKILMSAGYEVIHAPEAEIGFELALSEQPHLILLDLGLPDYDGQTLAGWLRAEPKTDAPGASFPHGIRKSLLEDDYMSANLQSRFPTPGPAIRSNRMARRGFSAVELIAVATIIVILSMILVQALRSRVEDSRAAATQSELAELATS